jgi:hypothetical protein
MSERNEHHQLRGLPSLVSHLGALVTAVRMGMVHQ